MNRATSLPCSESWQRCAESHLKFAPAATGPPITAATINIAATPPISAAIPQNKRQQDYKFIIKLGITVYFCFGHCCE